jgi:peptidoglycan lytic transglycosylase G
MTAGETRPNETEGGSNSAGSTVAAPIARAEQAGPITPRSARARLEPERMPAPARPSRRARHPIVIAGNAILTILLIVGLALAAGVGIGKQRFEAPGPLEQDKIVNIPRGGLPEVADLLQREGVIEHKWVFIGGVVLLKARDDLKFGEYLFPRKASLRDVVDTIVEGKVVQHQVTIPEGLTSEQVVARLLENGVLSGNLKEIPREGTLLPDTYKFTRGYSRDQLLQRMQQAQRRIVQEAWERRSPDLPLKTPEQLIVLASIVEKETGRADERTRVAAVFMNRLKQRMKLQSDPTIIYGLVGGKGTLGRPIMRSEITQPTPYNTYVIEGLPPGPIANPGRAAIEAAASPSRTKELYFVADGSGGHAFAETLAQHQVNVAKLRALEQQQRGEAAAGTTDAAPPDATITAPAFAPAQPAATSRSRQQERASGSRSSGGTRQQ